MRLDVFFHLSSDVESKLDAISAQLAAVLSKEIQIMATVDDLVSDVAEEKTLVDSIATYTQGLRQQITDALSGATLPAAVQDKINAVFQGAQNRKAALAAAMVASTPASDVPVDTPPTDPVVDPLPTDPVDPNAPVPQLKRG